MTLAGWFYLHENGDLIYKREIGGTSADLRESPFVRAFWPVDSTNRASAWRIVCESLAFGANPSRVQELAAKWGCDDADAQNYADHLGITLERDGSAWCAKPSWFINLAESVAGFGESAYEAIAELAKALDLRPDKTGWGHTIETLCAAKAGGAS